MGNRHACAPAAEVRDRSPKVHGLGRRALKDPTSIQGRRGRVGLMDCEGLRLESWPSGRTARDRRPPRANG